MKTFSMEKLHDEIKERAPFFHSCLSTASINRRTKATSTININFASVAMAAAVCLKNRSRYMTSSAASDYNIFIPLKLDGEQKFIPVDKC